MAADLIAFVLNLDAERELADANYRTPPAVATRIAALRARVHFMSTQDRVIEAHPSAPRPGASVDHEDLRGCTRAVAYCPTPSALAEIRASGLPVPAAPSLAVLRHVNARAFASELGRLPHARYVRSLDELRAGLRPETMLLKRDFGFAGRERRQVRGGTLDEPTEGFARRSFARGEGLQLEPWVEVELEVCQHGYLPTRGGSILAEPRLQQCDAQGSWLSSAPLPPGTLADAERTELAESTAQAVAALRQAGYFGPFVLDAYRYRDRTGSHFQPCSELNARLSMGYPRALLRAGLAAEDRELSGQTVL